MSSKCPTVFDSETDYYKREWQDYYPTIIPLIPSNSNVLDVGCGRGGLLEYLRDNKKCHVTGLDISEEALEICRKKGINVIKGNIETAHIQRKFDVIILCAILEHLVDPVSLLKKLRNNLTQKGSLVILVPNFSHLITRMKYLAGKNVKRFGSTKKDKKLGVQPSGHINFFNKATLQYLLERTGYTPIEWSYHKSPSLFGLYKINHELFSLLIAVKARIQNQ